MPSTLGIIAVSLKHYSASYLVVGGGGSGGISTVNQAGNSGAGGAGGVLSGTLVFISGTTYTFFVGAGGAGSTTPSLGNNNGANSTISGSSIITVTAIGGGHGGGIQGLYHLSHLQIPGAAEEGRVNIFPARMVLPEQQGKEAREAIMLYQATTVPLREGVADRLAVIQREQMGRLAV